MAKRYTVSDGRMVLTLEEAEEGGYVVTSPLDPELVTEGESLAECFEMAQDAMRGLQESRRIADARLAGGNYARLIASVGSGSSTNDDIRAFFRRWRGANGEVRVLEATSHPALRLELHRGRSSSEFLLVVCYLPKYFAGPVRWNNADLDIREHLSAEDGAATEIFDSGAGLSVRCLRIDACVVSTD